MAELIIDKMDFYVLGFVFTPDAERVALIKKLRPKWQAGKLNGIGGKIEDGETPMECISREFEEETGVSIPWVDDNYFMTLRGDISTVYCFAYKTSKEARIKTTTDEEVGYYGVSNLPSLDTVDNLQWLVPLAKISLDEIVTGEIFL
jgi:8-oxo-dGTP diphosphatase